MINLQAIMIVDMIRNSSGHRKTGYTPRALREQRQTTILTLMDLALPRRPPALRMESRKLPALWLSNPRST